MPKTIFVDLNKDRYFGVREISSALFGSPKYADEISAFLRLIKYPKRQTAKNIEMYIFSQRQLDALFEIINEAKQKIR